MSADLSKKRKDKKKKKAMLEALQAEEYREERAHVQLVDGDEEEPVLIPQDQQEDMTDPDDVTPLINEEEEGSGSGICSTIIFVCLLSALGLAVGVIFFEMGGLQGPLSNLANLVNTGEPVTVTVTETETLFVDEQTEPPSPIQPDESLKDFDEIEEPPAQSVPEQMIEPALVESDAPAQETIEPVVVTEAPVEETPEIAPEQPEPAVVESKVPVEVESLPEPEEIIEKVATEPVAKEEIIQEVTPEPVVEEKKPVQDAPEPVVVEQTEDLPSSSNFETQLEDEPVEAPLESFTMRAEREAVQEAMDQVWVLAVRCVEELRSLQVMSKSQVTLAAVDIITQRMEPLRNQLDYLVKSTSDNNFDGALEQTADLERNLMTLLEELEQARIQDAVLAEEMARAEQEIEDAAASAAIVDLPAKPVADQPLVESEPIAIESDVQSEQAPIEEAIAEPLVSEPVETPVSEPESPPAVPDVAEEELPVAPDVDAEKLKEVDEPIQVATEAFLVQPEEEEVEQAIFAEEIVPEEQEIADTFSETQPNLVTEDLTASNVASAPVVDESVNEEPSVLSKLVQEEVGESISLEKIEEQIVALTDSESESPPAVPDVVQDQTEEKNVRDDSIASLNLEETDRLVKEVEEIVEVVEQNSATAEDVAPLESMIEERILEDEPKQEATSEPLSSELEQVDTPVLEPESLPVASVAAEEVHVPIQVEVEPPKKQETREDLAASLNLEDADRLVDQSPAEALILMEQILERDPAKALALYGRARALDSLAETEKSNARLEQSIFAYRAILDLEEKIDDVLFRRAALRCIDRMRFRGFNSKAIRIQQRLVSRFPNEIQLQNQLAVGFLLANQPESAKSILESVIERWPHGQGSGFAQVHLGFILKTTFGDNDNGARWMAAGISSRDEGVVDGRFYFHLGDAYERVGLHQQAKQIYAEGEREGLFLSRDQRSLYNVDRLTGRPWWDKESSTYKPFFDLLEANWWQIRDEGVALLNLQASEPVFADEAENLRDTGDWKQFELFSRGRKNVQHCMKTPRTCVLIENFPPALCKRGQVKFSVMHPGTHVWPHTGPTNCRIRSHLGLVVPEGPLLRVGNVTKNWEEGKFIIFDDSFEHEVWHTGSSYRLVLIIDLWHPELTPEERRSLSPI